MDSLAADPETRAHMRIIDYKVLAGKTNGYLDTYDPEEKEGDQRSSREGDPGSTGTGSRCLCPRIQSSVR